jgi:two-component system, OmpR family, sensor histidine kinase CiaH
MFTKARFKLTASYLAIIVVILAVFSVLLFHYTTQHIRDNMEEDASTRHVQEIIVIHAIEQLGKSIVVGDGIVLAVAGILSYWLAGMTLRPIKVALDAQEQFSAHASHELRTPLSVIKTDIEVFLKKQQPTMEDAKAVAARNLEEVNRMSGMVQNLLALARSKKANIPIELEEINIMKPLDGAIRALRRSAEAKRLSLVVKNEGNAPILGNERLLEQLFSNLLQNAVTYTKEGGITITVSASKNVSVQIADTGVGIAKEELRHIFEPFYKADTSRSNHSGGVGLGLAIVKEIADKHKASIRIESEPGRGTTATIRFPLWRQSVS